MALAIKKFGQDNFTIQELCVCTSREELDEKEKQYILQFNTIAPNGYNLEPGGRRPASKHPITARKISRANLGRKASDATKLKLSISHRGIRLSKVARFKVSQAHKGKSGSKLCYVNAVKARSKTVTVISPEGERITINNISAFCREKGLQKEPMGMMLLGLKPQYRGYTWAPDCIPSQVKMNLAFKRTRAVANRIGRRIPITLISPDGISHTITNRKEFCKKYGLEGTAISQVNTGRRKQYKGWHLSEVEYNNRKPIFHSPRKQYKLINPDGALIETSNLAQFCRENNLCQFSMLAVKKGKRPQYLGWRFAKSL